MGKRTKILHEIYKQLLNQKYRHSYSLYGETYMNKIPKLSQIDWNDVKIDFYFLFSLFYAHQIAYTSYA